MVTVRGAVTRREERSVSTGTVIHLTVMLEQERSIPVAWQGGTGLVVGDLVDVTGEVDSEGILMATSIVRVNVPPPVVTERRFYLRRVLGACFLGDSLAYLILALMGVGHETETWFLLALMSSAFSAGAAALLVKSHRKPNAKLAAILALAFPLAAMIQYSLTVTHRRR